MCVRPPSLCCARLCLLGLLRRGVVHLHQNPKHWDGRTIGLRARARKELGREKVSYADTEEAKHERTKARTRDFDLGTLQCKTWRAERSKPNPQIPLTQYQVVTSWSEQ
ncbi:hypothetical protein B0T19DRAFT_398264 [Cercophora scortea]|uniref:Uncharacterized protein n=1 Tax=Cercophora scortea TaxID=314031 RepID=A0AAE0IWC7_9PEZI|nr:hypothetical protein B0T19DRAFT_398264 [Cercophora scortea]